MRGFQALIVALIYSCFHLVAVASCAQEAGASVTCNAHNSPSANSDVGIVLLQSRQHRSKVSSKRVRHGARKKVSSKRRAPIPEGFVDRALYLDTVRDTLTGVILKTPSVEADFGDDTSLKRYAFDDEMRGMGSDWCDFCYSMGGTGRVDNIRKLMEKTIEEGIPGDFLEAGAWRGGCSIMARLVQKVMGEGHKRHTYVCDSFRGLPLSSQTKDVDRWNRMHFLEVSQSEVEDNMKRFQALDDNVHFKKGYFYESMPKIRQELNRTGRQLAVLRMDGDMYESLTDTLYNLYDFVAVGGYVICDDCRGTGELGIDESAKAVDDFRKHHGISDPIQVIKASDVGTFWRKGSPSVANYSHYMEWNATRTFRDM